MSRWKEAAICVAGLATLGVIGASFSQQPVLAQNPFPGSAPVSIVNPVPLPVTGTVTVGNLGSTTLPVSVTNFPATQTVAGTVNIGTLPAVQAVIVNAPGSTPFAQALTSAAPQFAIPSTIEGRTVKAVVITELSGSCTGIGSFNIGLQVVASGTPISTFLFRVETLQAGVFPLIAQQTQIYVAAGQSVAITDTIAPHGCRVDLSGYYMTN
jgi:hypothetical protein